MHWVANANAQSGLAHADSYCNGNYDANSYANSDSYGNGNSDSYCNGYTDCDDNAYTEASSNTKTSPDASTSAVVIVNRDFAGNSRGNSRVPTSATKGRTP